MFGKDDIKYNLDTIRFFYNWIYHNDISGF